ncbi:hypothetical protein [Halobacillus dabanensis]|nr:hypothetical protein [Halobacillus dabanensis]
MQKRKWNKMVYQVIQYLDDLVHHFKTSDDYSSSLLVHCVMA